MPKIYLSPAYHKWNPCSIAGCDETTHNNLYMDELEVFLKACGIEYKRGTRRVPKSNEDGTALMNKAIKESNAYKPDIHYVSHTNAANGTVRGYRPMIYPTNNAAGEKLASIIIKYRKEIYNQPINLVRTDTWAELRETSALAYYEEHVFHDNLADAQWFHDNLRNIARQTCKGFCEYFGIKYVEPYNQIEGFLDSVNDMGFCGGWATKGKNDTVVNVTVNAYDLTGKLVSTKTVAANNNRPDLKSAGYGNGNHGFNVALDIPKAGTYTFKAFVEETQLKNTFNVKIAKASGHLDTADNNGYCTGWAINGKDDNAVSVTIKAYTESGKEVTSEIVPANQYRVDLKNAGYGSGNHGFNHTLKLEPGTYVVKAFVGNIQLTGSIKITVPQPKVEEPVKESVPVKPPKVETSIPSEELEIEKPVKEDNNVTNNDGLAIKFVNLIKQLIDVIVKLFKK